MTMGGGDNKVKESQYDKELAVIAGQKWKDYQTTYKLVENAYRQRVMQFGGEAERNRTAGYTASAVQQELAGPLPATRGNMSTGGTLAAINQVGIGRGSAIGLGTAASDAQGVARKQAGIQNIIAMGREIENSGIQGLSNMAAMDTSRSYAKAEADQIKSQGMYDAIGTGVGYGLYSQQNGEAAAGPDPRGARQINDPSTKGLGWGGAPRAY